MLNDFTNLKQKNQIQLLNSISGLILVSHPKKYLGFPEEYTIEKISPNTLFDKVISLIPSLSFAGFSALLKIFSSYFNLSTESIKKSRGFTFAAQSKLKRFSTSSIKSPRLLGCLQFQSINQWYSYSESPSTSPYFDKLVPYISHYNRDIAIAAGSVFSNSINLNKEFRDKLIEVQIKLLELETPSEFEVKGSLRFFSNYPMLFVVTNTSNLIRVLKALLSLKFEQKWELSPFLTAFFNALEEYRPCTLR